MSEDNKLIIKVGLDNAEAKSEAKDSVEELKKVEKQAEKTATTEEKGQRKASDATKLKIAEIREAEKTHRALLIERMRQEERALLAQQKATEEVKKFGVASGIAHAIAQKGLQEMLQMLGSYGQAVDKVRNQQQSWADSFVGTQDKLAELAAIQDKDLNAQFVKQFAEFGKQTGMRPDEGLNFQTALLNTGAQFVGKNISESENEQFKVMLAKSALMQGISTEVVGGLGGTLLGTKNWQAQYGDQAAEELAAKEFQLGKVLAAGSGNNATLTADLTKLVASQVSEDRRAGITSDPIRMAKFVSTIAEARPDEAVVYSQQAINALRDPESLKRFKEKAGVTRQDDPEEAIRKLTPVLIAEAEKRGGGTTLKDILMDEKLDIRAAEGIAIGANSGVLKGVFDLREQTAKQFEGVGAFQSELAEFDKSGRARRRRADAGLFASQIEQGAKQEDVEILRRQALADLIDSGVIESTSEEMKKFLADKLTFGALGDQDRRQIDDRAKQLLDQTAKERGVDLRGELHPGRVFHQWDMTGVDASGVSMEPGVTPGERTRQFNRSIAAMRERGIEPLNDNPAARRQGVGDPQDVAGAVERGAEKAARNQVPKVMTRPTPGGGRAAVSR